MRAAGRSWNLLRRLAHWMLKEPELEEETLTADGQGRGADDHPADAWPRRPPGPVTITGPDGTDGGAGDAADRAGAV